MDKNGLPIVSIIMPVYNRFALANEALASVVAQTYRPIEIIIVDDCSIENYQSLIQPEQNLHLKIIRNNSNSGPGSSRENGRLISRGEYIAYLDSDDLWHPQKLEKQVAMLQMNPKAGMCYCQSLEFEQLPITGKEPFRNHSNQDFNSFLPTILFFRPWGTSACLWTKSATEQIGSWSSLWYWEDYVYEFKAGCLQILPVFLNQTLCFYRVRSVEQIISIQNSSKARLAKMTSVILMTNEYQKNPGINSPAISKQLIKKLLDNVVHFLQMNEIRHVVTINKTILQSSALKNGSYIISSMIRILSPLCSFNLIRILLIKIIRKYSRSLALETEQILN